MKSFSKTHLSFHQLYDANFQGILTFLRENQAMVYDFEIVNEMRRMIAEFCYSIDNGRL